MMPNPGLTFVRPWHEIKPNKRTSTLVNVIYLAVQSQQALDAPAAGDDWQVFQTGHAELVRYKKGVRADSGGHPIASPLEWWIALYTALPARGRTWIVCQNAASTFTMLRLWDEIDAGRLTVRFAAIDSMPWIMDLDYEGKSIRMIDSGNYLPLPRDDHPSCQGRALRLRVYAERIFTWWHHEDLGTWRSTSSGCAWNAWRHRFLQNKVELHGVGEVLELERAAYRGGRVECLFQGKLAGPIHVLDIRSAYPWSMGQQDYPVQLIGTQETMKVPDLRKMMENYAVAAHVSLDTQRAYPCKNDRWGLCYPTGKFVTTLCGVELSRALVADEVLSVGRTAWYTTAPIFRAWVDWYAEQVWEAEYNDCDLMIAWIKALGRSLYGRWGQWSQEWIDMPGVTPPTKWGPWWDVNGPRGTAEHCRSIAGYAQHQSARIEGYDSWPIIAAMTTAYVRQRLAELVAIAGEKQVYYYDTDELHVTDLGLERLGLAQAIGPALGQLRLKRITQAAEYHGPRDYQHDQQRVWAGVGGSKMIVTEDGTIQVKINEQCQTILARSLDGVVRIHTVPVRHKAWTPPGGVDQDGWVKQLKVR